MAEKDYKAGLLWIVVFTFFVIIAVLIVPTLAGVDDWRFRLFVLGLMLLAGGIGICESKIKASFPCGEESVLAPCNNDSFVGTIRLVASA